MQSISSALLLQTFDLRVKLEVIVCTNQLYYLIINTSHTYY